MLCLLAGCFFLRAEAKRADLNRAAELLETEKTTSTNGQYCNVKETASDLQPSYANPPIQFSFKNAEGGCSPLKCRPYFFTSEIMPRLWREEVNETSRMCDCLALDLTSPTKQSHSEDEDEFVRNEVHMLHYPIVEAMADNKECSPSFCMKKYSDAFFLLKLAVDKRMSVTNRLALPDHWEMGCVEEGQQYSGVLPDVKTAIGDLKQWGRRQHQEGLQSQEESEKIVKEAEKIEGMVGMNSVLSGPQEADQQRDIAQATHVQTVIVQNYGDLFTEEKKPAVPKAEEQAEEPSQLLVNNILKDDTPGFKLMHAFMITQGSEKCNSQGEGGLLKAQEIYNKLPNAEPEYQCRRIERSEECKEAMGLLKDKKKGFQYSEMNDLNENNQPGGCFVRYQSSQTRFFGYWKEATTDMNIKRIRPGKNAVGVGLVCGCFEEIVAPLAALPAKPSLNSHFQTGNPSEAVDISATGGVKHADTGTSPVDACMTKEDDMLGNEYVQAHCLCSLANKEEDLAQREQQCTGPLSDKARAIGHHCSWVYKRTKYGKEQECQAMESDTLVGLS